MGTSYLVLNNKNPEKAVISKVVSDKTNENFTIKDIENTNDIYLLGLSGDKRSIGIAEVKKGISFLNEKPYHFKHRVLCITNSERMTTEAQNSLLKTLEEPSENAQIFLFTQSEGNLLQTVISRCKKVYLSSSKDSDKTANTTENVLDMSCGERLDLVEKLAKEEKDDIIEELKKVILSLRSKLSSLKTTEDKLRYARAVKLIEERMNEIDKLNINVKLSLEELFLNL